MAVPGGVKYAIIGAGIHGLSTAYHLALKLKETGRGSGKDILVVDKTGIAAGASGIACGVVRNNYFQPAMRELMAHSVEVWESDPKAYSYHPVGYMQISPEVMHEGCASIYEQQKAIGYPSAFIEGEERCQAYMRGLFDDWQAKGITSVLHEKKGGYANNTRLDVRPCRQGRGRGRADRRRRRGQRVRVRQQQPGGDRARHPQGRIACDYVVVGVGPWINRIWNMLELPRDITVVGRDGKLHDGVRMWKYWCLEEGTLGVDPGMHKTNDGRMPPVIHVDTDAPLYSDVDGSLITDKLWGLYYKPDFNFGGVQGGASPYVVAEEPDEVAVDPYGPDSPDFIVGDKFIESWCSMLAHCQKRFEGKISSLPAGGEIRRHRLLHARQFPGVRRVPRQCLRHRRFQSRLQDARASASWWPGDRRRELATARAVPLLALCRGQAASGVEEPVPVELMRSLGSIVTEKNVWERSAWPPTMRNSPRRPDATS